MHIKKYEAKTMGEALSLVKKDLGPDAVILSTASTKLGARSFGLFGSPMVEITAALDRHPTANRQSGNFYGSSSGNSPVVSGYGTVPLKTEGEDTGILKEEIKELRRRIAEMKNIKKGRMGGEIPLPKGFEDLHSDMIRAGVVPQLAKALVESGAGHVGRCGNGDSARKISLAKESLAMEVMSCVKVSGGIKSNGKKGMAVAFVGPTGVGKTTTIAKLAAKYSMKGKNVGLISIDTYRVGAVEQFKTYAKILKSSVAVASTPRELREKIKSFKDKDLIFIDTAGRSQRDHKQISFLKEFFPNYEDTLQVHLLMSATTKDSDIADIVKKFGSLPIERHIFTKLDECSSFGSLLNVAARYKVPYSYFTTGQRVPEDVELATPERVADLILKIREEAEFKKTGTGRK